jgi:hypothetical protein
MRHYLAFVPVAASLLLAGCSLPEQRVRNGLINAGLRPPVAGCMAERMVDRLSLLQLKRLGSLSNFKGKDWREIPMDEFLHNVRSLKDPEIIAVTTTSGFACALR